ncbi:centromere protein U [Sceloporus undulatus]|uniref:centromere protein U n=1 Tax=Sceloporus undulatus TaxID=8520 RepID=UPI001C4D72F0|nr:centromere protein U [Sceloporus undulatus]
MHDGAGLNAYNAENFNRKKMPKAKTKRDSKKVPGGHEAKLQSERKFLSPDEPDVSSILKVPGIEQTEESDDVFDLPLHSTAVSDYEEEEEEEEKKEKWRRVRIQNRGLNSNSSHSEPEKKNTRQSKNQDTVKSRVEREDSEKNPLMENKIFRTSGKSQRKQKKALPEMEEDDHSGDPHLFKVWIPKGQKKGARRITEIDVILNEFEKVTAKYKGGVELEICREAIDSFSNGFRDHLINTIADAEELKNTKLKNMKMVRETNKKRQRLIEVKEELIRTEPQLKKLEREHAEVKEKISSLRNAMKLVNDLKDLQQKYVNEIKENPQENVEYGISSLPALLVESQRILGAEGHFRNINTKLQQALNLQKKN